MNKECLTNIKNEKIICYINLMSNHYYSLAGYWQVYMLNSFVYIPNAFVNYSQYISCNDKFMSLYSTQYIHIMAIPVLICYTDDYGHHGCMWLVEGAIVITV